MKKIFITIAFMATGLVASAQVGVGTTNPLVSLQVDRSIVATEADGVLVPRVTVAELNAKAATYGSDQNGALVFITAIAGAANETVNVTATGFHFYNSTTDRWVSLASSAQQYQNIRGGVQLISGVGSVADDTYFLVFNGSATSDISAPTPALGKTFWVRNIAANGNNANITGVTPASQLITAGRMRCFVSDGTNWYPSNQ